MSQNPDAFNTPVKRPPGPVVDLIKENINPTNTITSTLSARVVNIFEDTCSQANDFDSYGSTTCFYEELSQAGSFYGEDRDAPDLLDDFKRKKL